MAKSRPAIIAPGPGRQAQSVVRFGPGTPILVGFGTVGGAMGALLGGGTGLISVLVLDKFTTLRRVSVHGTATMPNFAVAVVGSLVYW